MFNYVKHLSEFLDQHVPTSYLHKKPISKLIKALGKSLRLSELEIQSLEYASLLHDAGKIKVPSSLLKKQKPLTDEEFQLIAKQPRGGVELIRTLEMLRPASQIVHHQHEKSAL